MLSGKHLYESDGDADRFTVDAFRSLLALLVKERPRLSDDGGFVWRSAFGPPRITEPFGCDMRL